MDPFTIIGLIYWLICMILFGPMMFFVCVYLPEVPVRYVKSLRQYTFHLRSIMKGEKFSFDPSHGLLSTRL